MENQVLIHPDIDSLIWHLVAIFHCNNLCVYQKGNIFIYEAPIPNMFYYRYVTLDGVVEECPCHGIKGQYYCGCLDKSKGYYCKFGSGTFHARGYPRSLVIYHHFNHHEF